jgi:hypothetical protein
MVKLDAALEAYIAGESVEYAWESEDKDTGRRDLFPACDTGNQRHDSLISGITGLVFLWEAYQLISSL